MLSIKKPFFSWKCELCEKNTALIMISGYEIKDLLICKKCIDSINKTAIEVSGKDPEHVIEIKTSEAQRRQPGTIIGKKSFENQ